jgi:hypothetical protein
MHEREKQLLQMQPITLEPAGKFEQEGRVGGFLLPDGSILMNTSYRHEANASGGPLSTYARFLQAKQIVIHGKWVFVPDTENSNE